MPSMMTTSWASVAQGEGTLEGFDLDALGDLGENGLRVAVARMFSMNAVPPNVAAVVEVAEREARNLHRAIAEVAVEVLLAFEAQGRDGRGQVIPPAVLAELREHAEAEQRRQVEEARIKAVADDLERRSSHRAPSR